WGAAQRFIGFLCEERVAGEAHAQVVEERGAAEQRMVIAEAELETARLQAAEDEQRLQELQTAVYELDNRIKLGEAEADHEEKEAHACDSRAEEARGEIERVDAQRQIDTRAREEATIALQTLEEATAGQADQVRAREEVWRGLKDELAAAQRSVDTTRSEVG